MGTRLTINQVLSISRDKRSAARVSTATGIPVRKIRQVRQGRTFKNMTNKDIDGPSSKRVTGATSKEGACIDNPLSESASNFDLLGTNVVAEFDLTGGSECKALVSPEEEQALEKRFACPETAIMTQREMYEATKRMTKATLELRIPKG